MAWLDDAKEGFRSVQIQYLRLSYQLGPNEGWIAGRRSRLALATFERLPPDLAETATCEFARLVDGWLGLSECRCALHRAWLADPRSNARQPLGNVGERQRKAFAKALYTQGYDVVVPEVDAPDARPWR